jgi:hypothetical protein
VCQDAVGHTCAAVMEGSLRAHSTLPHCSPTPHPLTLSPCHPVTLSPSVLLQSKLAALASEAESQKAQSTSVLTWQGRSYSIRHERVRVCVHQAQELAAKLASEAQQQQQGEAGAAGLDGQLGLYDKMLNLYNEAKGLVSRCVCVWGGGGAAQAAGKGLDSRWWWWCVCMRTGVGGGHRLLVRGGVVRWCSAVVTTHVLGT